MLDVLGLLIRLARLARLDVLVTAGMEALGNPLDKDNGSTLDRLGPALGLLGGCRLEGLDVTNELIELIKVERLDRGLLNREDKEDVRDGISELEGMEEGKGEVALKD